ncbi:hypothetical protein [Altererythrobacter sp. Root672]|nr:hypothetical protein [Altererythrobacter sp. Root672]
MKHERKETGLVELGTASLETRGLPIAPEPESMGFKVKSLLVD